MPPAHLDALAGPFWRSKGHSERKGPVAGRFLRLDYPIGRPSRRQLPLTIITDTYQAR